MISLASCFLKEVKEICQFLKGSCESLMESIASTGREHKKKNNQKHRQAGNNLQKPTEHSFEGKKEPFFFFSKYPHLGSMQNGRKNTDVRIGMVCVPALHFD